MLYDFWVKGDVILMNDAVYIIAEAGVNHNGNLELAKKLVLAAKETGADAVKFQTFKAENLVTQNAKKAAYQIENTGNEDSQYKMLKKLELAYDEFAALKAFCDELGIEFISTPFDFDSIDFLESIGVDIFKIPSGEITNYPYLVRVAKTGKKIILSTGMSTMQEVKDCINILQKNGAEEIFVLHCTTEYPADVHDVNLRALYSLQRECKLPVGYSDHTDGIEISVAAAAMGARIIEKHFTLDKNMDGPDHKASLEPAELKTLVQAVRNVEAALGDGLKKPSDAEKKNIAIVRKSIVAKTAIVAGEIFTENNITTKRPGTGISPMYWNEIIGKKAKRNFAADEMIEI